MGSRQSIDWDSQDSTVLLNPKWSARSLQILQGLSEKFFRPSHIWVASSGSSAVDQASVKLIALSKEAFLTSAEAVNKHLSATKKDIWIQALLPFHVGGQGIFARAALSGSKTVFGIDQSWDAKFYQQQILTERATLSSLVPTQVFDLVQSRLQAPPSIRAIVVGGAHLSDELYHQALDLGWPLLPSYGLTECCSQVATACLEKIENRDRSLRLLSHVTAQLNDGGLKIKSPSLLTGFAQFQEDHELWCDPKIEGWYQTEDLATVQGHELSILGRETDFVKILGEGVNLSQLQKILDKLVQENSPEQALDFAIGTLPDQRQGHVVILATTSQVSDSAVAKILSQFNLQVAAYERISQVRKVAEIPRTDLGKISRAKLQAIL